MSLWNRLFESLQTKGIEWAVGGLLALIGGGLFWLWGWFAAGGLPRVIGVVPSGAVLAFATECPKELGWHPFTEGTGRVVVGAGDSYAPGYENWYREAGKDKKAQAILLKETSFKLMDQGGEANHQLTVPQLPSHAHEVYRHAGGEHRTGPADGFVPGAGTQDLNTYVKDNWKTGRIGDDDPHNNMPPYVALYYCKKD